VRHGADVRIITVFAGDPERVGPPSYWDARRSVSTAAEATAERRAEDLAAAGLLGASVEWLPFDDAAYVGLRDPVAIWSLLEPALKPADLVLLPGWPLSHPDHRWVTMLVAERIDPEKPVAYYTELPYAAGMPALVKSALTGRMSDTLEHALHERLSWVRTATTPADRRAKARAVAAYAGEVSRLGYRARVAALHDLLLRRETVGYRPSAKRSAALMLRL
jgi:hypothetical protein